LPALVANVNDTVVVNVYNGLGNETTGIHFHGLRQSGTATMDGPSGVNQCSIPPGASFTYTFTVCHLVPVAGVSTDIIRLFQPEVFGITAITRDSIPMAFVAP
jgi:hypothetical protein